MSFFRSFLMLSLVTIILTAGLLALGFNTSSGGFRGGYAVISADASVDDRLIQSRLNDNENNFINIYAGSPVSESSQWVMLDEFGSLQTVPLDQYGARVLSFDPRNDGYADKLKNIFVHDGKRFIFIPLKAGNSAVSSLDRQLAALLGDIHFSAEYIGVGKPLPLFFITYAASSLILIIICLLKKKSHPGITSVFAVLPVLSCLVFSGVCGFAAAALILGLFVCLREPAGELVKHRSINLISKNVLEPYKMYWPFFAVFAAALAVMAVFTELKLFILLPAFAASAAVFLLSIKTMSLWGTGQRRFVPVMIMRRRLPDFSFSLYMSPLAAAAFVVMFLTPYMPGAYSSGAYSSGAYSSGVKFPPVVEEKDYYAHLAYQASFSTKQLGGQGRLDSQGSLDEQSFSYPAYLSGEDGLPVPDLINAEILKINFDDYPPFPVKHLMGFLNNVNSGGKASPVAGGGRIIEYLPLLILLLFILSGLLFNGKIVFGKILLPAKGRFAGFKRFAVMLRRTDINRKNVLLYNGKNNSRIRKDA